jgi:predicted transcriptional regulator
MKGLAAVVLMAVALFGAMPAFAAEHSGKMMDTNEGMMMDTKEGLRECAVKAETIQQKITRLETEVAKGTKKYSAKEVNNLAKKLKEANEILDKLNKPVETPGN